MAKIAIVLANDFEDSEFVEPYTRLREAGHEVVIVGERAGEAVRGKRAQTAATVDSSTEGLYPGDFDALVIPGGYSPDHLRLNPAVVSFVQGFFATGKPVAAICHAAQLLIEAEVVRGKTMTSWPSVRKERRSELGGPGSGRGLQSDHIAQTT